VMAMLLTLEPIRMSSTYQRTRFRSPSGSETVEVRANVVGHVTVEGVVIDAMGGSPSTESVTMSKRMVTESTSSPHGTGTMTSMSAANRPAYPATNVTTSWLTPRTV